MRTPSLLWLVLACAFSTPVTGQEPAPHDTLPRADSAATRGESQEPDSARGGLREDELFGRLAARGSYEIRSLATDSLLGREDWELFEDAAGFQTIRGTASFRVDGVLTSRMASVTVNPELEFVEADIGSTIGGLEAYATYQRAGDVLTVEAFGAAGSETRQQVRLPADGVFVSQLFATRGWELAPFGKGGDEMRPAYLAGSAPGILVGQVRRLGARLEGRERISVRPGRFEAFRFAVPNGGEVPSEPPEEPGEEGDRWWVLAGSRLPAAAELASLGVRLELVVYEQDPESAGTPLPGPVLARGVYHHRPLRGAEPLAVESWTLAAAPGGFLVESEVAYAEGKNVLIRALADSLFRVREVQLRRRAGREAGTASWVVAGGELQAEARGGGVGLVRQRFTLDGPLLFRLDCAALEGWAVAAEAAGKVSTYWLPAGPHPLGTLLELPPEVDLGEERLSTPARTFTTRRYASPAQTAPLLRSTRWVFGPYRLAARVVFPTLGREAILVRYETPEQ